MKVKVIWRNAAGVDVDIESLVGALLIEIAGEDFGDRQVRLAIETGLNRVEFAGKLALTDVLAGYKLGAAVP